MPQFNLQFSGGYDTRLSANSGATSTSGYVDVAIVDLAVVEGGANNSMNKDSRFINCYPVTMTDGYGRKKTAIIKRPGWSTLNTPAAGYAGEELMVWTGSGSGQDVIAAFGETNSTIYKNAVSIGAITGECTGLSETFIGTTPTILASGSDSTGWYYDAGVGVMTKITDVDFPGNAGKTIAGTFVNMHGYAFIMCTDSTIWASDLNSVTAWTATSFDTASDYPDRGIGLVRNKNLIIAFGTESMQFFQNAGLTPFPLAKVSSMTAKVGAISYEAITQISDVVFWAGSTPQGGISIFQFDGGIKRISTPEIELHLAVVNFSSISLTSIRMQGRSFVLVRAYSQTYVYCIESDTWHEWSSTTPLWHKCAGTSVGASQLNYAISHTSTSGKVYIMDMNSYVFTDDGYSYTASIQGPSDDMGTRRKKFFSELEIDADKETSTSTLTISYSDDDYQNTYTWGSVDLSDNRPRATRLGSATRRAWIFTHSSNTPMRLYGCKGFMEYGQ